MAVLGFEPYKGDWVEAEYSVQPDTLYIKTISVKPMNCKHMDEVIHLYISLVIYFY